MLPTFVVEKDIVEGRLVRLMQDYESEPTGVYALYPHRKHLSAEVRLLIDGLVSAFQKHSL